MDNNKEMQRKCFVNLFSADEQYETQTRTRKKREYKDGYAHRKTLIKETEEKKITWYQLPRSRENDCTEQMAADTVNVDSLGRRKRG